MLRKVLIVSSKKFLITLFLIILITLVNLHLLFINVFKHRRDSFNSLNFSKIDIDDELFCHNLDIVESLPDILDYPPDLAKRNIFFLETSCRSFKKKKLVINPRQACAVESAAAKNRNMEIYLTFTSAGLLKNEGTESDRILAALESYPNINFRRINVDTFSKDTPAENLFKTGKIKQSKYKISHSSDVLRYLTLWKYGGIYLDLDLIVLKPFLNLPENFAGAENTWQLAAGILGFSHDGKGFQYITECITDLGKNFNGIQWAANGPEVVTRNILKHCPKSAKRFKNCDSFTVFKPEIFYPIYYTAWTHYFDENQLENVKKKVLNESLTIHLWNKLSFAKKIPKKKINVPYLYFATRHCPKVVAQLDKFF